MDALTRAGNASRSSRPQLSCAQFGGRQGERSLRGNYEATTMKGMLTAILYLVLASVVLSTSHSVWVGIAEKGRYQNVFPGAQGVLYWITLLASLLAGVNCVFIGLRKRWAILLNPLIGLLSIALIEIVAGPRANEVIILVACAASTGIAWHLYGRRT